MYKAACLYVTKPYQIRRVIIYHTITIASLWHFKDEDVLTPISLKMSDQTAVSSGSLEVANMYRR